MKYEIGDRFRKRDGVQILSDDTTVDNLVFVLIHTGAGNFGKFRIEGDCREMHMWFKHLEKIEEGEDEKWLR